MPFAPAPEFTRVDSMITIADVEKLAFDLPEAQRAILAAHLLESLPSVLQDDDERTLSRQPGCHPTAYAPGREVAAHPRRRASGWLWPTFCIHP